MPYIYKSGQQFGMGNITINTPTRELTQAQYEALPASEKSNGTIYFITDASSDKIVVNDPAPIGAIMAYSGATAPGGWLLCQGQAVSRTTYSELFAVIGTTYGSGNGSSTFNLPDLRGNVAIGASQTFNLGDTGGSSDAIVVAHNHGILSEYGVTGTQSYPPGNTSTYSQIAGSTAGTKTNNTYSIQSTGQSGAGANMQPYIVTNYIIKAKDQSLSNASMLTMVDFFYPVGSYYETSSSNFNPNNVFGGTWSVEAQESSEVLSTETSMSASAVGTYYTGTMITLQPNTHYLLLGYGSISVAGNYQTFSSFYVSSGTAQMVKSFATQPYAGAGNGHNFQAYIETGSSSVGVGVSTYHYDTGYTKTWLITAIPIHQYAANCYRWHRTA